MSKTRPHSEISEYPFAVAPYKDDSFTGYRAFLIDIPAIESLGKTPDEAIGDLGEAGREWLAFAQAKGIPVPEPDAAFAQQIEYSGRVTLRMPQSLHRQVSQRAALEGVSLNAYLNSAIERALYA
jgi:predicted RNase H-like HicB family nuclease